MHMPSVEVFGKDSLTVYWFYPYLCNIKIFYKPFLLFSATIEICKGETDEKRNKNSSL